MTLKASIRDSMTSVAEADLLGLATDIVANSGVQSVSDGDCLVSERGAGANMSVDVALGTFWVEKSSFVKNSKTTKFIRGEVTAIENAIISANASGNDRIDLVCVKYLNSATPTSSDGEGVFQIHVEEGTPAGSPTAPATPNDCEALAQVYVANGASSIVDANITDVRTEIQIDSNKLGNLLELANNFFIKAYTAGAVLKQLIGLNASDEIDLGDSGIAGVNIKVNNVPLSQLNNAGSSYLELIKLNNSDQVNVGEDNQGDHTVINAGSSKMVKIKVLRQNNTTDTYKKNTIILTGWGYQVGDNTSNIFDTLTFGITFSEVPIILVTGGGSNTSVPADPGDVNSSGRLQNVTTTDDETTGCIVYIETINNSTLVSSRYFVYKWIAIGQYN